MVSIAGETWFQDAALQKVLAILNGEGFETRIAGGAVRNALMGQKVADVDLATTLLPAEVTERAEAAGLRAVPTGLEHGTVTVVADHRGFEVTTLRRDVATDGRRAEVAFGSDWAEDAARRDLTINGLYATASGEVIDLVGGLADIESRTVRFIGDADARVAEDHLRILRFFRFFAWYGGGRPDAAGLRASARARDTLKALSAERVWSETRKLLSAPDPGRALLWMRQAGVLGEILPETEKWGIEAIPGLIEAEAALGWPADPMLRLTAMLPPDAERLAALSARLRLSRAEAAVLTAYATAPALTHSMAGTALDRLLYRTGKTGAIIRLRHALAAARREGGLTAEALERTARLTDLLRRAERFERPVFPVSGKDAMAAGMAPGPALGERLAALETAWVDSNFTLSRETLLERLAP